MAVNGCALGRDSDVVINGCESGRDSDVVKTDAERQVIFFDNFKTAYECG